MLTTPTVAPLPASRRFLPDDLMLASQPPGICLRASCRLRPGPEPKSTPPERTQYLNGASCGPGRRKQTGAALSEGCPCTLSGSFAMGPPPPVIGPGRSGVEIPVLTSKTINSRLFPGAKLKICGVSFPGNRPHDLRRQSTRFYPYRRTRRCNCRHRRCEPHARRRPCLGVASEP